MSIQAPESAHLSVNMRNVKTLLLTVHGKALKAGDDIILTYGDKTGGGPGTRAQTYLENQRFFWISVDAKGDNKFVTLKDAPFLRVVGGEAERLVVSSRPMPG